MGWLDSIQSGTNGGGTMGEGFFGTNVEGHDIPLFGQLFEDPAEKKKLKAMRQAAAAYQQRQYEQPQYRINAGNQQLQAYQPANQLLGQMYGPEAMQNLQMQNPLPSAPPPKPKKVNHGSDSWLNPARNNL